MPEGIARRRSWGDRNDQAKHARRIALLRRGGFFEELPPGTVRRAADVDDLAEAYRLTHDTFVEHGYIHPDPTGIRLRVFEALPETATFVAKEGKEVVAVISVVPDSEDVGLPTDHAFKDEVDRLRAQGRTLCEGTNWAVAPSHHNSPVMTELMRCSFAHALAEGCTDFLGTVSPGHAKFYALLGFEQVGEQRVYDETTEDRVVLMRFDLVALGEVLDSIRQGGNEDELFLKRYWVENNPYNSRVSTWSIVAGRLFEDTTLLTVLFVRDGRLIQRLTPQEAQAVAKRWGRETYDAVAAALPTEELST